MSNSAHPMPTGPEAARPFDLLEHLQRGGVKSYDLTFDAAGHARATWYDSSTAPPAPPAGTNVYFGVNPCTAIPATNAAGKPAKPEHVRGRADHIAALSCLYAEFDAKDFEDGKAGARAHIMTLDPQPSTIVDSGGGYHCYWLLVAPFMLDSDEARQRAIDVQARWVTYVRGDKAAKDIARVLRRPGTLNYKYSPPRPVEVVELDRSQLYTLDVLQAMLPASAPKTRSTRQQAPAGHTDSLRPSVDFLTISKAAAALHRLSPERRDDYTGWLHVGMALRELGAIGYDLWDAWSKDSPKYQVGACADKWPTFRIGVPGSDITLDSLYRWANEDGGPLPDSSLDDAERRQLEAYIARDIQTQKILAMDAPLSAKAVIVGMLPSVEAAHVLVANKDDHSGSVAVNYGNFAAIMKTSDTTVGRAVDIGEQAGLWRKDPEYKETKAGYDIPLMRLDLQPAFFRPELAQPIDQKPRGGPRPGAGRKPKCADCPPGTHVIKKTTVEYICKGCGQPLGAEPPRYAVMPDDAPLPAEFKHELERDVPEAPTGQPDQTAEIKHELENTTGPTSYSCLKKAADVAATPEPAPVQELTKVDAAAPRDVPAYLPGEVWRAVWHGPNTDEPVTVIGLWDAASSPDGRAYYQVRESATGMPADEVELLALVSVPQAAVQAPQDRPGAAPLVEPPCTAGTPIHDAAAYMPAGGWTAEAIAALPGVRSGLLASDDPWLALQYTLRAKAAP